MDEDRLIEDLAGVARREADEHQKNFDERWDALSAGSLPPEEAEEMAREAEQSPQLSLAHEAFRPLGTDFQNRVIRQIRQQLAGERPHPHPAPILEAAPSPRRVSRRLFWRSWALAAALLATIALTLLQPSPPDALPEYEMILNGTTRQERSSGPTVAQERLVLDSGNLFSLILKPAVSVEETVEPRFFLARPGELEPWSPQVEKALSGAFRVEGHLGQDLELPTGDWQLIIIISRPDSLPDLEEARRLLDGGDPEPGWIVLKRSLKIRGG